MDDVLNFFTAVANSLIMLSYLRLFFPKCRQSQLLSINLALLANILISYLTTEMSFHPLVNGLLTLLGFLLLALLYEGRWFMKGLFILLLFCMSAVFETLGVILVMRFRITQATASQNAYAEVFTVIALSLIFMGFKLLFKRRIGSKHNRNLYSVMLLPLVSLLTVTAVYYASAGTNFDAVYITAIGAMVITFISYALITEFDKAFKTAQQAAAIQKRIGDIKTQNEQLSSQYQLMFDLVHSENQFFLSLDKSAMSRSALLSRLEARLLKVNRILSQLNTPSSNGVSTVVNYFVQQAKQQGIMTIVNENSISRSNNQQSMVEQMVVLTIVLSNAVKQAAISDEQFIAINLIQNSHGEIFTVTNSFTKRLEISSYSVQNLKRYGLDIQQVEQLVDEMGGEFQVSTQDDFFKVDIVIPQNL